MALLTDTEQFIVDTKLLRVEIEKVIGQLHSTCCNSAETTLAKRKLQEAKHWLGEELNRLGAVNPYPNGNNPENTVVDPKADVPAN